MGNYVGFLPDRRNFFSNAHANRLNLVARANPQIGAEEGVMLGNGDVLLSGIELSDPSI